MQKTQTKQNKQEYDKQYYLDNKKHKTLYKKLKYKIDFGYKIASLLRARIHFATGLRGLKITANLYSPNLIKKYIEMQFVEGMTWQNFGNKTKGWSIEFVKPLTEFDLTDQYQLANAISFTNLKVVWNDEGRHKRTSETQKKTWAKGNRPLKAIQDQNGVVYRSAREASRALNLHAISISRVLRGLASHTGGYRFTYAKKD